MLRVELLSRAIGCLVTFPEINKVPIFCLVDRDDFQARNVTNTAGVGITDLFSFFSSPFYRPSLSRLIQPVFFFYLKNYIHG